MNVSAYTVIANWAAAVAGESEFTGATFYNEPVDPTSLTDDELPAVVTVNYESASETLDWMQRETTLEWEAWIIAREETLETFIARVEVIEDLSESDATLTGTVTGWHVASWALYRLPDTEEDADPIRLAMLRISTERIEP